MVIKLRKLKNNYVLGWQLMNPENHGRPPGVIFTSGPYWKELRRFMLRNLKDFGFGKSSMEQLFHDEVSKLCQTLNKKTDQTLDLAGMFNVAIVNSLWSLITSEKLDHDDPALLKIVAQINHVVRNANPISPIAAALPDPRMSKWPLLSKLSGYYLLEGTFGSLLGLIEPYLKEHKKTLDPENIRDFLDLMLAEQQKSTDPQSCFHGELGTATILNAMIDMFFAGMETTSSTLLNMFLHILHHPDVQDKVYEEIERVTYYL